MRGSLIYTLLVLSVLLASAGWRSDFAAAKADAKKDNKLILLRFSGSDWCLPCMRMERDVFDDTGFKAFADRKLELVCADFPRMKKHQLSAAQTRENEALAEQYDKEGRFPYTVLLNADGKVLREWDGYDGETPAVMMQQINAYAGRN